MANVTLLAALLLLASLSASSQKTCDCDKDVYLLDSKVPCDGTVSKGRECMKTCSEGKSFLKHWEVQIQTYERVICKNNWAEEINKNGVCYETFVRKCMDIVPKKDDIITEKLCGEKQSSLVSCLDTVKDETCKLLATKVVTAVAADCLTHIISNNGAEGSNAAGIQSIFATLLLLIAFYLHKQIA